MRSGQADQDEDSRHWLVHVARRDAQIGPHKFRLQDIYGLSSSSSSSPVNSPPTIEDNADSTPTYPPQTPAPRAADAHDTEGMRSECVLCLSLPREVVLLPCRHLVACRDCAVNMVEYGAGGHLHTSEPTGGTGATDTGATETGPREGGATGRDGAPRQSRRRRRAKGWFCPVCRQPYTSLLRISTTTSEPEAPPAAAVTPPAQAAGANQRPQGRLTSKPGFLRGLSRNPSQTAPTTGMDHPLQTPPSAASV